MLTLSELKELIIQRIDEVTLLDMLEITSEDLVNAFIEKVEDKFDVFVEELDEDMERDDSTD